MLILIQRLFTEIFHFSTASPQTVCVRWYIAMISQLMQIKRKLHTNDVNRNMEELGHEPRRIGHHGPTLWTSKWPLPLVGGTMKSSPCCCWERFEPFRERCTGCRWWWPWRRPNKTIRGGRRLSDPWRRNFLEIDWKIEKVHFKQMESAKTKTQNFRVSSYISSFVLSTTSDGCLIQKNIKNELCLCLIYWKMIEDSPK